MKENDVSKPEWEIIWTAITESPGIVVVLGASDTGKTTWVRATARWLVQHGRLPIALVDTDIGQASLGPPATVAMRLLTAADGEAAGWFAHDTFSYDALSFIGSVSPMGHTLQLLVSSHRLVEQAKQKGTAVVLVDTTGLITPGFGFQLKLRKIELLNPIHVVALQRSDELESLLMVIDRQGRRVHRLRVSDSVKPRTAADRAIYRARRLAAYFAHAHVLTLRADHLLLLAPPLRRFGLPPSGTSDLLNPISLQGDNWTGHLVGLNDDNNHTLGLGLLQGVTNDGRSIRVRTPLRETVGVSILQLGEPASLSFRRRAKREA